MSRRSEWAKHLGVAVPETPARRASGRSGLRQFASLARPPAETERARHERFREEAARALQLDPSIPDLQKFEIHARPKPRQSQRDKWDSRPAVERYRIFADLLRLAGAKLPKAYEVHFVLPMPAQWSEDLKSAMDGMPHLLRPDASNLQKAVEDALVEKDEVLFGVCATKRWGRRPLIVIRKLNPQQVLRPL